MKEDLISSSTVFKISLLINLISVIFNSISDCDETYNYWEPLHFLIFDKGFQTWEYSPDFGLRSYLFLFLYGWPGIILKKMIPSIPKLVLFYAIRIYLMIILSILEKKLYKSLKYKLQNDITAFYCILFFILSAGSFISSSAFLPSSFAMFCSIFAVSSWLKDDYNHVISSIAFSSILGWPFSAAIGIPFAIDIIFIKCGLLYFFKKALFWGILFSTVSILFDSYFYGSLTFPSLNIIKYNVFNSHGSELYGTESISFYLKNYILNFNIGIILCAILLINVIINTSSRNKMRVEIMVLSVLIIWNVIFFIQPHKEERFLFPCYPFIAISCGICLHKIQIFISPIFNFVKQNLSLIKNLRIEIIGFLILIFYGLINISRILSLIFSFNSSIAIYHHLNEVKLTEPKMLCLGREWHRFPSSFFLNSSMLDVSFIKSSFKGQLPAKFKSLENTFATKVYHKHFNDLNKEETSRYLHLSRCHYIIDRVDSTSLSLDEPNWETLISSHWERKVTLKMMSPSSVGTKMTLFRSFYVPVLFDIINDFVDYVLLERF